MGKTPKLKTTLRKTPAKQETPADVTSDSSEAVSNNPWATESSVKSPDLSLSGQLSKVTSDPLLQPSPAPTARESDNASITSAVTAATSNSQPLETSTNGSLPVPGAEEPPKARRKKTVTKTTPHTFELEDELKSRAQSASDTNVQHKRSVSYNPPSQKERSNSTSFNFSPLRTALNLPPIDAPPPPSSPRPRTPIPNNPFASATKTHRKSSSNVTGAATLSSPLTQPYRFVPPTRPLDPTSFFNKVVVITHASSLVSASLVRQLHSSGARVIFGDPSPEKSRKIIKTLGPPDIVHFQKCDVSRYSDIVDLFKLAVTMYGRVDHAVFGVGDDGGAGRGVGAGEGLWGVDVGSKGRNKTAKEGLAEVESEKENDGAKIGDVVSAGVKFARVAVAYLKYTSKGPKKRRATANATPNGNEESVSDPRVDRSLTLFTSTASFKGVLDLLVYQVSCHAILGIVRSLAATIDPERDGIRVNAVITNIMIPTAKTMVGGRMSVQLPVGRVEDVGRVVAGVVGDGSLASSEGGGGVHGRALYVVGEEGWDVEDGLRRGEKVWLGERGREGLERAEEGWCVSKEGGGGVEWMLMDGLE